MARIEPVKWQPPAAPGLVGMYEVNHALADVEIWPAPGVAPEDVVLDTQGHVYAGLEDGRILRYGPDGGEPDILADTNGRPLGLEIDGDGNLVICDAYRGLLRLEPDGTLRTLADSFEGEPFLVTNNAAIGTDGTIYFSVSSTRFDLAHYKLDLMEHSGTGRLFALHPDGDLEVLLDGLYFSNGVALSGGESFVAVAETGMYRVSRLWLAGEHKGEVDVLVDNLPGFPDNVSQYGGVFWIAIPSPRDKIVDALGPRPWLAKAVAGLPERFQPAPSRHAIVVGVDEHGTVVHNLQDPDGAYAVITGVRQFGGYLYFGSLADPGIARLRLADD
ncbi:MAG TPA: SMP-30/gluconolactonase/LRE family protein [Actinobacteria bacterium]|nr:strictosidine synthase [bacterium BMS3Bbin01]HDH24993.1 SMP-30/gluconolactonase/LRE family protein [Actinomycetota bacterium]